MNSSASNVTPIGAGVGVYCRAPKWEILAKFRSINASDWPYSLHDFFSLGGAKNLKSAHPLTELNRAAFALRNTGGNNALQITCSLQHQTHQIMIVCGNCIECYS